MDLPNDLAKQLADQVVAEAERAITGQVVGTQPSPATLSGAGLTFQDVMKAWWELAGHQPWRKWLGHADLRPSAFLGDLPAVAIETSTGCLVIVKPEALTELKKAWREFAAGYPLPVEPTDRELAAMMAWVAEGQAIREGRRPMVPGGRADYQPITLAGLNILDTSRS